MSDADQMESLDQRNNFGENRLSTFRVITVLYSHIYDKFMQLKFEENTWYLSYDAQHVLYNLFNCCGFRAKKSESSFLLFSLNILVR